MFGAKLTLIVLTSGRLARIDLAGPRGQLRVERVLTCPAIPSSELTSAIAIAYRLGERSHTPGASSARGHRSSRSLVVLSDDIWNDTVTLPLDVTVLLQPAEIEQALAIEAENFSGINAFSSRFTSRQLADASSNLVDTSSTFSTSTNWWVAQIASSDLASMSATAEACGVKFLGATHWQAPWRVSQTTPSGFEVSDSQAWKEFGQHWAQALSSDGFDLLIRPEPNDLRRQRLGWIQTSAALATALACGCFYHMRSVQLESTESNIENLQQTLSAHEAVASKVQAAQTKLQQTRQKVPLIEANRPQLVVTKTTPANGISSSQWLAILDALATQTPEDCWIESWHSTDGHPTLIGRAVTAQAVHELASRLEQALGDSDWRVQPPIIQLDQHSLFKFELPMRLLTPNNQHSSAAQPSRAVSLAPEPSQLADNSQRGGQP